MMVAMLFPIIFPIITGFLLLVMKEPKSRKLLLGMTGASLVVTGCSVVYALFHVKDQEVLLFRLKPCRFI